MQKEVAIKYCLKKVVGGSYREAAHAEHRLDLTEKLEPCSSTKHFPALVIPVQM